MILSNASCFPDLQEGNFSALRAFSLKVDVKQQLRQTKGRGNKDDAQARVINTACKKKTLKRLINPQKKKIKYSRAAKHPKYAVSDHMIACCFLFFLFLPKVFGPHSISRMHQFDDFSVAKCWNTKVIASIFFFLIWGKGDVFFCLLPDKQIHWVNSTRNIYLHLEVFEWLKLHPWIREGKHSCTRANILSSEH